MRFKLVIGAVPVAVLAGLALAAMTAPAAAAAEPSCARVPFTKPGAYTKRTPARATAQFVSAWRAGEFGRMAKFASVAWRKRTAHDATALRELFTTKSFRGRRVVGFKVVGSDGTRLEKTVRFRIDLAGGGFLISSFGSASVAREDKDGLLFRTGQWRVDPAHFVVSRECGRHRMASATKPKACKRIAFTPPARYTRGTPARALAQFFSAWKARNFTRMKRVTRVAWLRKQANGVAALRRLYTTGQHAGQRVIGFKVRAVEASVTTAVVRYQVDVAAGRVLTLMTGSAKVVRENSRGVASASGQWRVDPVSAQPARDCGAH